MKYTAMRFNDTYGLFDSVEEAEAYSRLWERTRDPRLSQLEGAAYGWTVGEIETSEIGILDAAEHRRFDLERIGHQRFCDANYAE